MTLGCGAEHVRAKRRPDTFKNPSFNDDIHDHFASDKSDLSSLLQFASDQELLELRAQAQRLREEKLAQHEELLRQQLERPSNNNRFIRFPATGEETNKQIEQINNQNIPTQTVRPSSAFTHRPQTEPGFDLSSFSNKLLLDLFLKPEISRQPEPQKVEIQPIFSRPGQIVPDSITTESSVIRNNLRQPEQNPIIEPTSLDDQLAILRSLQNERQTSKRIEIKNQRPKQNKESQTFATFESVPLRLDVRKNNVEQPDGSLPLSNKDAPLSNPGGQFPNFPSTVNPLREIIAEKIRTVESSKFRPQERPRRIRPFKSKVEKATIEEKDKGTDEEEEKRRQEAGIKRRKELFNSAARRRKLLDSKRKQLRSRNQAKTTTVIPDKIKSTTEPHLPSPIISEAPTMFSDSDDQDQEGIIDEAIQAVLSRAVSGDVGKDPVVWAAVSAIYQFVDMQEQVNIK